jgi:hypothetical protein
VRLRRFFLPSVLLAVALAALTAAPAAAQPPPNDTFATATVVTPPFSETLDTSEATTDANDLEVLATCGVSVPIAATVWYAYTPPTDQLVNVQTLASYSTGVGVVTGSPGSFSGVTCFAGSGSFSATAGQTYYLDVSDISGGTGGTLTISITAFELPEVEFTVDRFGSFDPRSGVATVTGMVTCTAGTTGAIGVNLTQRVGRVATISGFGFADLTCDGTEQTWSVTVQPFSGKFAGGHADVSADAFVCGPAGCASDHVERTIVLRR